MREIFLHKILEYYDGILLFIGKDLFGTKYLCSLYEDEVLHEEFYLSIRVTDKRLSQLSHHEIDLRSALLSPESEGEYFKLDWDGPERFVVERLEDGFAPNEYMLPEDGYFCDFPDDRILCDMTNWKRTSFIIGADDEGHSHSLSLDTVNVISQVSKALYNAARKSKGEDLFLFKTSAASFNLHLTTLKQLDLFNQVPECDLEALKRMEQVLLQISNNPPILEEELNNNEVEALTKLSKHFASENLTLKYSYKEDCSNSDANSIVIPSVDIKDYLRKIEDVKEESEPIDLSSIGAFHKCNVDDGSWTFRDKDTGTLISGKSDPKENLLSGVTLKEQLYEIAYIEALVKNATGRTTKRTMLKSRITIQMDSQ